MLQKYLEPEVHYVADRGSQNSRQKDFPQESKFYKIWNCARVCHESHWQITKTFH